MSQRLETFPDSVTTDRILQIEWKAGDESFGGDNATDGPTHVYNLETEDGYYIVAGGIVASNCRPPDNKIEKEDAVAWCRPNLLKTLEAVKPERILLLGEKAVRSFVGSVWREKPGGITKWAGFKIPDQTHNAWVVPTYHPSYLLRNENADNRVLHARFVKHLGVLADARGRPWTRTPDWKSDITIELDGDRAAAAVGRMGRNKRPVAFDFETNMLKPDSPDAEIVCCAMSDGKHTVAYPWSGRTAAATFPVLHDPRVPKYGWNVKFEDRWTRKLSGRPVRGWVWDGMLAAHVQDSRTGICGLKFQSYVNLGQPVYDDHVKPYLDAPTGNAVNKIRQLPLDQLLLYCGMDALLEHKTARLQAGALGFTDLLEV